MSDTASLRDKTSAARRRHILDAAIRVFATRGFRYATIRDVAKAAGVADGTIYNAFENKAALLLGILDPLGAASAAASGAPPVLAHAMALDDFVRTILAERWAAFTPDTLAMLRVVLSEALVDPEFRAVFVSRIIAPAAAQLDPYLRAMAGAGTIATDDLDMTLRLMTAVFLGLVTSRLLGDERLGAAGLDVPGAMAGLLLDGLRPREDREGGHASA